MTKSSAGILVYRRSQGSLEVFLVHPGGPFFARKDLGVWSIPKGECDPGEDPFATAKREFHEETSFTLDGEFTFLGEVRQSGGKLVKAWAIEGDLDPTLLKSNTFTLNGRTFPEVDRGAWYPLEGARQAINPGQVPLLDRLVTALAPENEGI